MPLRDWTEKEGWKMLHHLWIAELVRWLRPRLPAGYRAFIGSSPAIPDSDVHIHVAHEHRLLAAIELVSPANKDRPSRRASAVVHYAAYIQNGIRLLLIDLLPKPQGFSFADGIAEEVGIPDQAPLPPPMAVSYLVGPRSLSGTAVLEMWGRTLTPGQPLPTLPLWLTSKQSVPVDLEATYTKAAADAYLE